MPSTEDIEDLIYLDGGFVTGISEYRRLGWRVAIPTDQEILEFNEENVIDYWSNFLINRYAGASCFRVNEELRKGIEEEFPVKFRTHLNV